MIFVTVGTHEQPFNRLIKKVDDLVADGTIKEKVIIQRGYSTYEPKHCEYYDLIPWEEMQKYYREARIIITHGGPASFIDVLALGKTPIVVPRQAKYNEHVNDHQLEFAKHLINRFVNIILVDKIEDLRIAINGASNYKFNSYISNNETFNKIFEKTIKELFNEKNWNNVDAKNK